MTRESVSAYMTALRRRYQGCKKKEKGRMLDEAAQVTGYHRKALVRLLRAPVAPRPGHRRGRPKKYLVELLVPLEKLWEATGRVCPQRLHPFLP